MKLTDEQVAALENACGLLAGLGKWSHARTIQSMLREQLERMASRSRTEDVLIDLVNQIRKSNPVDDHGHALKMNMAFVKAVELLDAAQPSRSNDEQEKS